MATTGFASMDDLIAANKRKSAWLVAAMFGLFALLGLSMGMATTGRADGAIGSMVFGLIVGAGYWIFARYFGSKAVLFASGAKEIEKSDHPQLWNVVEEMCIASNMQIPKVYIIDDSAPNAFATGNDPENSAVAITTGLLEKLDRDELQGVMAHELAHIQNYDVRLMTLMAVMVGAVAMVADVALRGSVFGGSRRSYRRRSSNQNNSAQVVWMVVAIICAILAPIAARLIMFSVSREREYLADATAARMTHFPEGLARALGKISGDQEVLEVANRATQHMYIINPMKAHEARAANSKFSTHPPVEDRVNRLMSLVGQV